MYLCPLAPLSYLRSPVLLTDRPRPVLHYAQVGMSHIRSRVHVGPRSIRQSPLAWVGADPQYPLEHLTELDLADRCFPHPYERCILLLVQQQGDERIRDPMSQVRLVWRKQGGEN